MLIKKSYVVLNINLIRMRLLFFLILYFSIQCSLFAQFQKTIDKAHASAKAKAKTVTEKKSENKIKFESINSEIEKLKKDTSLKNASISFFATDLESKETIAELNPDQSLTPASTQKIVTTAAALEILGVGTRFKTSVEYDGEIDSTGTLNGNIYIRGGGDPCLGSGIFEKTYYKPLFYSIWTDSIVNRKIKKISGAIIGDASIFDDQTPSTWIWGDMANYYGATAYGISIYDNVYSLLFDTGKEKGDSTKIIGTDPIIPKLTLTNNVKSSNDLKDNSYIVGAPFDPTRYVYGFLPKDKKKFSVRGSIPDPALLIACEFNAYLDSAGITTAKEPTTTRQLKIENNTDVQKRTSLCGIWSPRVSDIVYWTNHVSMNLYAETFVKHIGLKKFGSGDTWSGIKAITDFWKSRGIDTRGMYLQDGSGLSRFNSISARQIVQILSYMKKSKLYETFYGSLPTAGLSGTIKKMFKNTNAEKNLSAKSGYMSRIRSYGGYVQTLSKRSVAFSIIVNNYNCNDQEMKEKIEIILVKLADLNE